MIYILVPSLEHIALVKVAVTLWNQADVKAVIATFNFRLHIIKKRENWQKLEKSVLEKVLTLPQTGILKEKILGCIKPIGLQILQWMEYHCAGYLHVPVSAELFWTPQGTVDRKKTAEMLIKNNCLYISTRYKLACIYCFEDYILHLWNEIPENRRKFFNVENRPGEASPKDLVFLWTCIIKDEMPEFEDMVQRKYSYAFSTNRRFSPYLYALGYILDRNKASIEYFMKKLLLRERENSLVETARSVATRHGMSYYNCMDIPDIFCFLLSQMDRQRQIEVFKSCPSATLECLLDWPWQSFFLETANNMWCFLDEINYERLLEMIVNKVIYGYKDFNYKQLFGEFWHQSPYTHKRYVIDECASELLLSKLFQIKDEGNIQLIFQAATLIERKNFIICSRGQEICKDLVFNDEWDLLQFFIKDCISSEDDMTDFAQNFVERVTTCFSKNELVRNKNKLEKFYCLIDDFFSGYAQRKNVEHDDKLSCRIKDP